MKKFIKERSKVMLMIAIISVILFVLAIPDLLNYSRFIKDSVEGLSNPQINSVDTNIIFLSVLTTSVLEFNLIATLILIFATIFNISGYIHNKEELTFISVGLLVVLFCIFSYACSITGLIFLLLLLVLNLLGYLDQRCLNMKDCNKKSLDK